MKNTTARLLLLPTLLLSVCLPAFAHVAHASLVAQKPHQGVERFAPASHRGPASANSMIAPGLSGCLCDERRRSRSTGKERDAESGLDYFGARYYGSSLGRFSSVDPGGAGATAANPQSWNAYAYVKNNPLFFIDPNGEADIPANDPRITSALQADPTLYQALVASNNTSPRDFESALNSGKFGDAMPPARFLGAAGEAVVFDAIQRSEGVAGVSFQDRSADPNRPDIRVEFSERGATQGPLGLTMPGLGNSEIPSDQRFQLVEVKAGVSGGLLGRGLEQTAANSRAAAPNGNGALVVDVGAFLAAPFKTQVSAVATLLGRDRSQLSIVPGLNREAIQRLSDAVQRAREATDEDRP